MVTRKDNCGCDYGCVHVYGYEYGAVFRFMSCRDHGHDYGHDYGHDLGYGHHCVDDYGRGFRYYDLDDHDGLLVNHRGHDVHVDDHDAPVNGHEPILAPIFVG